MSFFITELWTGLLCRKHTHLCIKILRPPLLHLHVDFLLNLKEVVESLVLLQHFLVLLLVGCEVEYWRINAVNIVDVVDLWLVNEFVFQLLDVKRKSHARRPLVLQL